VGVDLEWSRPRNLLGLAKFAFAADELAWLTSLSEAEREPMFYALWTMKESMAKALGLPLLAATRECVFSSSDGQWRGRAPIDRPWSALSFQPRPDVTLAIVLIGKSSLDSIATIEWPPERSAQWLPLARVINP
jgi:phosphopantetheinyl transferase